MRATQIALLIALFASPLTLVAGEEEDAQITASALGKSIKQINTIGLLRYCGNSGLSKPIVQVVSDSIVSHLDKVGGRSEVDRLFMRIIQTADLQAEGVRIGLTLSQMQPARKAAFCKESVEIANELLEKSEP